jgi:hypothetical protein
VGKRALVWRSTLAKTLRWEQAIAARLVARGAAEQEALPVPKLALAGLAGPPPRRVRSRR